MEVDTEQFYPTPDYLACRMALKLPRDAKTLLEPSAGYGTLLNAACNVLDSHKVTKYFCEINSGRHEYLRRKNLGLRLADDFLTMETDKRFDAIIMNPPFNRAEDHFTKAYELLKSGGTMICLLSKATLDGKTNKEKHLLNLIDLHKAEVETIEGAFTQKDALRKTGVVCSLVTLKKGESKDPENDLRGGMKDNVKFGISLFTENDKGTALEIYNYLEGLVNSYNRSIKKNEEVVRAYYGLSDVFPHHEVISYNPVSGEREELLPRVIHQGDFQKRLRAACWRAVFKKTELANYMTTEMKREFEEQQESECTKEFTMNNIQELLATLKRSLKLITDRAISDVFKWFTKYHKKNRCHIEGWKTNSAWKVNRKVILPNILEHPYINGRSERIDYTHKDKLADIEKALCLMLGIRYEDITYMNYLSTIEISLNCIREEDFGVWHDSYFFKVKVFKKRTMHLVFKDQNVWEMFNHRAVEGKMWIGMD